MQKVRPAAVAGLFYSDQATVLQNEVTAFLAQAQQRSSKLTDQVPKAIIVPHGGYVYSGATAALAYERLRPARSRIRRVVLLGPVHRVPVPGLALPGVDRFETPLGCVDIDQHAVNAIVPMRQVLTSLAAHAQEHSLEVQLPFLQSVLDDFKLLPLAVGDATPEQVAQVLEVLWGGDETLLVISSDLSHFLPYPTAQAVDQETVRHILALDATLTHRQACGGTPVNGLLLAAQRHQLQADLLALCNSGDTAGDKDRVVGYASVVFTPACASDQPAGPVMLSIARAAIARALGQALQAPEDAPWLQAPGACFVTLTQRGQLRGCVGSLAHHRTLLADLQSNAVAAALHDTRFAPLTLAELSRTNVEVSLLSPLRPLHFDNEAQALAQLQPGIDGVVLECQGRRSTFLPQVWEQLPQVADFMAHLKRKAGLPADFWSPDMRLSCYTVSKWKEADGT